MNELKARALIQAPPPRLYAIKVRIVTKGHACLGLMNECEDDEM